MKRLLAAVAMSFALVGSAFAATPTVEPALPSDVGSWERQVIGPCTLYQGKIILAEMFKKVTPDSLTQIIVFSINGQKVDQREYSRTGNSPLSLTRYVRNSPGGNWLMYNNAEGFAGGIAGERMLAEVGLTAAELAACNK